MRIANKDNIRSFKFTHKGLDRHFRCVEPVEFCKMEEFIMPCESINIVFNDIYEVEFLISMLERFKNDLKDQMGDWK